MSTQQDFKKTNITKKFVLFSQDFNYYIQDFNKTQISFTPNLNEAQTFTEEQVNFPSIYAFLTKIYLRD